MRGLLPVFVVALLQGLLVWQLDTAPPSAGGVRAPERLTLATDAVLTRKVGPGERVVLSLRTTGAADVAVYESTGDRAEEQLFRQGGAPRTAKVFSSVVQLNYPLASLSGTEFLIRVHHRRPGAATVSFQPGTQDEAMGRLRRGENLERNGGTVEVTREEVYSTPLYQLVPGTVVQIEVEAGAGPVALLKVRDYLDVREGRATLASRCAPARCVDSASGRARLDLYVTDYDDLYVVAAGPVRFRYRVVATPEVLNYISSCT